LTPGDAAAKSATALTQGALEGLERFDLELRAGKSGASFSDYWCVPRHPVVMMNFAGSADDLGLLVHELGHALHYTLAGECQDLYWGLPHSLEFMEFNSHFLELLMLERLGAEGLIFDTEAFALARQNQARVILNQLMHVCRADRFQQWVYSAPAQNLETTRIGKTYLEIARPFQSGVNWNGLEDSLARAWLDEGLFTQPLYKIEYAFAWVGGLLLLDACCPKPDVKEMRSNSDPATADPLGGAVNIEVMDRWVAALEAGNTLSTGELFHALGLSFPFTAEDVERAAQVYERLFSSFL
jgi:oligoendopeptidase F